jgi:predicted S18 family serine protease
MPRNMHEGKNKVLFKKNRKSQMSTAALVSTTRSALGAMVEKEASRVGSRTVAYEHVAQMVGASSSWVRKFLADTGEVKEPRITLFQNIRAAYGNICERVERDNRADELRLQALKGQMNAVTEGFDAEGLSQDQAVVEE